jgi:hypothetical protein
MSEREELNTITEGIIEYIEIWDQVYLNQLIKQLSLLN